MDTDTIAAIATPQGRGGIGIVKISGNLALPIAISIFRKKGSSEIFSQTSHRLHYGHIVTDDGRKLDEVLLAFMKAPHSYTGEDVVEIQAHSGMIVLKRILELVLSKGARLAEAGEFTKRAYLSGRIDLTQAEAVMDMIHAKSERAVELAAAQLDGGIRDEIKDIRDKLLAIISEIEAGIDFPEDVGDSISAESLITRLQDTVIFHLNDLISRYHAGRFVKEGLKILIAGKPNVGKSSLMNRLLGKERVIVTPIPGTTRDLIEESFMIGQVPVIFADSAGLHDTSDPIEQIGMQKTYQYVNEADLILLMLDASKSADAEDRKIYDSLFHKPLIAVMNKTDLVAEKIPCPFDLPTVYISALCNIGMDDLKNRISEYCSVSNDEEENRVIPSLRHKIALEKSREHIDSTIFGLKNHIPFELVSIDIHAAMASLDEITGHEIREDVLDQIFSRFCIGK